MRIVIALGAIAVLAVGLSGCAVISAGSAVVSAGASVVGTAADIAGDVITAPFPASDSDAKKK